LRIASVTALVFSSSFFLQNIKNRFNKNTFPDKNRNFETRPAFLTSSLISTGIFARLNNYKQNH